MRTKLIPLAILGALLFISSFGSAQQRSRISGTVTDEEGNAIVGCLVIAENPTNMPSQLEDTTDDRGRFSFSGVRSGTWRLRYQADGFLDYGEEFPVGGRERVRREVTLNRATGEAFLTNSPSARAEVEEANEAMRSRDFEKAIRVYEEVLAKAPELHEIHFNIGLAKDQMGDFEGAARSYEAFLEAQPDNVDAMLKLAIALNRAGDNDRALELYEKVTEQQPDSGVAFFNMALMLFQTQELERARGAFERALELDASLHEAHFMLGHIHVSNGDTDAALASYEAFLELAPDSPNASDARSAIEQLKASRQQL